MTLKNELAKLASAIGSIGFGSVGLAAVFGGLGIPAAAIGGVALGAGFLSGATLINWGSRDEIGLLKDEKLELAVQLENAGDRLRILELELREEIKVIAADRDKFKTELERVTSDLMARCKELEAGIKYWEDGHHPRILDSPQVKTLIDLLKSKLAENTDKLDRALVELASQKQVNQSLVATIDELEEANELLDSKLANTLLELDKLKSNFDFKLRLQVQEEIRPRLQQAVMQTAEAKLKEITDLRKAVAIYKEELGNKEKLMELLEREQLPEIEQAYNQELSARDSQLLQLAGENAILKDKIAQYERPRKFPGMTYADSAGNQVIDHFFQYGVTFDAHSTQIQPGGFRLKFWVDRNQSDIKLSTEEFNKIINQRGLMGISNQPIKFDMDRNNFLVWVDVFPGLDPSPALAQDLHRTRTNEDLSTVNGAFVKSKIARTKTVEASEEKAQGGLIQDTHRQKFVDLGCYPKDQFWQLIAEFFSERFRVVAGSTGGKSPLLEMICLAIAKRFAKTRKNGSVVFFPNPIPGGDKDYFLTPSIVQSGDGGFERVAECLSELLAEVLSRCGNLADSDNWPFIMLMLDEANMIARYNDHQGELIKNVLQAGSHAYVGLGCSGQGLEITGWSGKSKKPANMLRANDFVVGATQVWIDEAALIWINKAFTGQQREDLVKQYNELTKLCSDLNKLEGLQAKPLTGGKRKVDKNAYRFAFVTRPAGDPFFFQIPDYGCESIDGLEFPDGAAVTSKFVKNGKVVETQPEEVAADPFEACSHCLSTDYKKAGTYADGRIRYRCCNIECRKYFAKQALP